MTSCPSSPCPGNQLQWFTQFLLMHLEIFGRKGTAEIPEVCVLHTHPSLRPSRTPFPFALRGPGLRLPRPGSYPRSSKVGIYGCRKFP